MKKRKRKSGNQFVMHSLAMLQSPAFQVLSRAAHKVLVRIEIEHCTHGGADNGRLPVTYDDFCRYGIDRHAIGPALREATALGFTEITQHGIAGNAEHRRSNELRLTYLDADGKPPTNEWAAIQTVAEAQKIADEARANKPKKCPVTKKIPGGGFYQNQCGKPPPGNGHFQCGKPPLKPQKAQWGKPTLLSRLSSHIGVRGDAEPAPPEPEPEPEPEPAPPRPPRFLIDLTGKRFGRLVVTAYVGGKDYAWSCTCDCGALRVVSGGNLRKRTRSCGCLLRDLTSARSRTHGMYGTPEYKTWASMKQRCLNPRNHAYKDYGGRGIKPCDEWLAFESYFADTGTRPPGKTLDRWPNNNGNYEPGNVRWADAKQQRQNQRPPRKTRKKRKPHQVKLLPLDDPPF